MERRRYRWLGIIVFITFLLAMMSVCAFADDYAAEIENPDTHEKIQYATLQDALNAARDGDTVTLLKDVQENVTFGTSGSVEVVSVGEGSVGEGSVERMVKLDLAGHGITGRSNGGSVITVVGDTLTLADSKPDEGTHKYSFNESGLAVLDDNGTYSFTGGYITGGTGTPDQGSGNNENRGGGIYVYGAGDGDELASSFFMTGGTVIGNKAGYGGGLWSRRSVSEITGGAFIGNTALTGGGIYWINGSITMDGPHDENGEIKSVVISNNTAYGEGSDNNGCGGGFYFRGEGGEAVAFGGVSFSGNKANEKGGGLYFESNNSETSLDNCSFTENTSKNGGGAYFKNAMVPFTETVFSGNSAAEAGGGIYCEEGTPKFPSIIAPLKSLKVTGNTGKQGVSDNICLNEECYIGSYKYNDLTTPISEDTSGTEIGITHCAGEEVVKITAIGIDDESLTESLLSRIKPDDSVRFKVQRGDLNGEDTGELYLVRLPHEHSFDYSAGTGDSANTITASCSVAGCTDPPAGAILTIKAPALTTYGGTGSAAATLDGLNNFNSVTGEKVSESDIRYAGRDGTTYAESATAPVRAGKYTASITSGKATASVEYTIAKKEVKVSGITAADKIYDGTTTATLDCSKAQFDGILEGDKLTVEGTGAFDNANAGEGKTVSISGLKLGGEDSDSYVLAAGGQQSSATATVEKAPSVSAVITAQNRVTNGSENPLVIVNDSTLKGGEMQYAVNRDENTAPTDGWTTNVPATANAGLYCVWYKVVGDMNHKDTEPKCVLVSVLNPDNESSATHGEKYAIVPAKDVEWEATITEGTAVVNDITKDDLGKIVIGGYGSDKITVTIDLSDAKQEVTSVELTKKSVENLSNAASGDSSINSATIKMTSSSVELDGTALKAVSDQAGGDSVKLVVDKVDTNELNAIQAEAVKKQDVAEVIGLSMESDGRLIHDFKGGQATVSLKFEPAKGRDPKHYHLYYLHEDGSMTRHLTRWMNGFLQFITGHFSEFAIVYDESITNETGTEESTENTDESSDNPAESAYGKLTPAEKTKTDKIARAYGTDKDTAAEMLKTGGKLGVSIETMLLTPTAIGNLKSDSDPSGTFFSKLRARASKRGSTSMTLQWTKQKDADGYLIYSNKCGKKNRFKLVRNVTNKNTVKWNRKKLRKQTYYKYIVVAYKNVNGNKLPIAASAVVHCTTKAKSHTIAKGVKVNKKKVTVSKGKTFKLKASEIKAEKKKKIKKHRAVLFESANPKIATVGKKTGKITGKKAGTTYIYAYAQNGVYSKIKVTVK